ncbi:hypothetical protein ART_1289 [Arthrobacter sp. PAMC 25486]|nr:hypothetical protein ART_1289 [Arthrobacter sp. PAMC 25486]
MVLLVVDDGAAAWQEGGPARWQEGPQPQPILDQAHKHLLHLLASPTS